MTAIAHSPAPAGDTRVIALVSVAHGLSHFMQLVLPPLFPQLKEAFGVSYTELGLLMTLFYATSGLAQTPAGFLVDRIGARAVLIGGTAIYAAAIMAVAFVPPFWMMLPLAVLAGLGNSVYHPSDLAILTRSVSPGRLGRAYGIHTLVGNLGWAAAPASMLGIASMLGWRAALLAAGVAGLAVLALLLANASALRHEPARRPERGAPRGSSLKPLLTAPILLCFAYFALLSVAMVGVQTFLPATLNALYGTLLTVSGAALTTYLLGGAVGMLAGGMLADRTARHDMIVMCGLAGSAVALFIVGQVAFSAGTLLALMAVAGLCSGITTPSRDLLVRAAAPRNATGRVFGFVYSGLDTGSAVTPALAGFLLDIGRAELVLVLVPLCLVGTMMTVLALRRATTLSAAAAE